MKCKLEHQLTSLQNNTKNRQKRQLQKTTKIREDRKPQTLLEWLGLKCACMYYIMKMHLRKSVERKVSVLDIQNASMALYFLAVNTISDVMFAKCSDCILQTHRSNSTFSYNKTLRGYSGLLFRQSRINITVGLGIEKWWIKTTKCHNF